MTKSTDYISRQILWVDLEMTGLDPVEDRIMEVAAIVTDWDFKEIATYEAVQEVDDKIVQQRMVGKFWDSVPESRQALIDQNSHGLPCDQVEEGLLAFIDEQIDSDKPVLLAGNSIHQDRKFIEREWPRLNERLHYRMLDISSLKLIAQAKYGLFFSKKERHRALDDIRESIDELKYYLNHFKIS